MASNKFDNRLMLSSLNLSRILLSFSFPSYGIADYSGMIMRFLVALIVRTFMARRARGILCRNTSLLRTSGGQAFQPASMKFPSSCRTVI